MPIHPRRRRLTVAIQKKIGIYGKSKYSRARSRRSSSRLTSSSSKRRFGRGRSRMYRRGNRSGRSNRSGGARRTAVASFIKSVTQPLHSYIQTSGEFENPLNGVLWRSCTNGPMDPVIIRNYMLAVAGTGGGVNTPSTYIQNSLAKVMVDSWTTEYHWVNQSPVPVDFYLHKCRSRDFSVLDQAYLIQQGFWQAMGAEATSGTQPTDSEAIAEGMTAGSLFDARAFVEKVKILSVQKIRLNPGQPLRRTLIKRNFPIDLSKYSDSTRGTSNASLMGRGELFYIVKLMPVVQRDISGNTGLPVCQIVYDYSTRIKYYTCSTTLPFLAIANDFGYEQHPPAATAGSYNHTIEPMSGLSMPTDYFNTSTSVPVYNIPPAS